MALYDKRGLYIGLPTSINGMRVMQIFVRDAFAAYLLVDYIADYKNKFDLVSNTTLAYMLEALEEKLGDSNQKFRDEYGETLTRFINHITVYMQKRRIIV